MRKLKMFLVLAMIVAPIAVTGMFFLAGESSGGVPQDVIVAGAASMAQVQQDVAANADVGTAEVALVAGQAVGRIELASTMAQESAITSSAELVVTMKTIDGTAFADAASQLDSVFLAARQSADGILVAATQTTGHSALGSLAIAAVTKDVNSTAQVSGMPISFGSAALSLSPQFVVLTA